MFSPIGPAKSLPQAQISRQESFPIFCSSPRVAHQLLNARQFLGVYTASWIGALALFSLVLMRVTLATFDRRMGRVAEIPESWHLRPLPRPEGWSQGTTVVSEWTSTDAT